MITQPSRPAYVPASTRYETMQYRTCGNSGLKLPLLSLGLWQNFGAVDALHNSRAMLHKAFDLGITHFDLANNYGPPFGSAESTFGQVLQDDLLPYRDELLISSKAGWDMWPGPYGIGGSRKYLIASIEQSLKRTGLEYFDIFYSHCPDPSTPIEETMGALDYIVRSGKALYVGISSYSAEQTDYANRVLRELGTPLLIHQPRYNIFDRRLETEGLLEALRREKIGAIVFSPLEQGILTDKYLQGVPADSRAARSEQIYLSENDLQQEKIDKARQLNEVAQARGQSLAQMAIAWVLRDEAVTSAIIGASKVSQIEDSVAALKNLSFSADELQRIDAIVG
ncbi:L-glyceraldehyde 3-phosphate reductase [Salinispirillum sp. LH 10-3-1]|uniref:L-glyceraldehyde 3-phosphate reductase n=1 Tax=Salinispirillum sp. LH 10-3-1 TaxID=2952525 RepID=A0AB38YIR6_9GAMM